MAGCASQARRDEHRRLDIRHSRTLPPRLQTNGGAERLDRIRLEERASERLSRPRRPGGRPCGPLTVRPALGPDPAVS